MGDSTSDVIQVTEDFQVYYYITVVAMVVVTYDVFLTLDREIDLVWKRGLRVGSIAYLLARYATPLSMLMDILSTFMPPDPITGISQVNCEVVLGLYNAFNILSGIGAHILLLARVYAICHRRRWLIALPLACFLGHASINLTDSIIMTCTSTSPAILKIVTAGDVFAIGFDLTIFALTAGHTWRAYQDKDAYDETLIGLILKQGILRFGLLFFWELEVIVVKQLVRPSIGGVDVFLEAAIATTLICRFHLDLAARNAHMECGTPEQTPVSTLSFHAAVRRIDTQIDMDFGDNDSSTVGLPQSDPIELHESTLEESRPGSLTKLGHRHQGPG